MLNSTGSNAKIPLPLGKTPTLDLSTPRGPLSSPVTQHFGMFFPIGFYCTDSICFLCVCVCPNYITEKIELPNSTSTDVEMTPSSETSEPVQNGNLSHSIEVAEAQVRRLALLF